MKNKIVVFTLLTVLFCCIQSAYANKTLTGHYGTGLHQLKPGTMPDMPGLAYKGYFHFQQSMDNYDSDGNKIPGEFDSTGFIATHKFLYTPDYKISFLGDARLHTQLILPISVFGTKTSFDSTTAGGLGDITINPLMLSWHYDKFDFFLSFGVVMPTGNWDNGKGVGKNFWTSRVAGGVTWYVDDKKEWAVSLGLRHEKNFKTKHMDLTQGSEFSYEWSLSKMITPCIEFGLVGAGIIQIEDDKGRDAFYTDSNGILQRYERDYTHNIGVELSYMNPEKKYAISISPKMDFGARGRPEYWMITTAFTYLF